MDSETNAQDTETLNQEVRDIWNTNAAFWDSVMGEGNQFQKALLGPTIERLLNLQPGELVLEIACGNGMFARRMAQLGVHVVATDFSEQFIELARAKTAEYPQLTGRIEYKVVDATDEAQILALGKRRFDAVVCNMAMMDMSTIDPMLSALGQVLKTDGRFVFSIMHPCFNNAGTRLSLEEEDRDGELIDVYSIKVVKYLHQSPTRGLGIIGQPEPHYYFFRPLNVLFNSCFQAGFVMNALEEPAFGPQDNASRALGWANFKEFPPVMVARMILAR